MNILSYDYIFSLKILIIIILIQTQNSFIKSLFFYLYSAFNLIALETEKRSAINKDVNISSESRKKKEKIK